MKNYALFQDDGDTNKGVSFVCGPNNANLKELHKEFRELDIFEESQYIFETWDTYSFASWLVKFKGFSMYNDFEIFDVDEYKTDELIERYDEIRNNPDTPKSLKEAKDKIKQLKKNYKNPKVLPADDPSISCKG
jgi:chromatin segregation and condensation protein Rec8/ScpA/Scc1 (kleisin family)